MAGGSGTELATNTGEGCSVGMQVRVFAGLAPSVNYRFSHGASADRKQCMQLLDSDGH